MSVFLKTINSGMEYMRRTSTLQELKKLDNRQLNDLGFSRELLNQGVTAWPWGKDMQTLQPQPHIEVQKQDKSSIIDASKAPHFAPAG